VITPVLLNLSGHPGDEAEGTGSNRFSDLTKVFLLLSVSHSPLKEGKKQEKPIVWNVSKGYNGRLPLKYAKTTAAIISDTVTSGS
jgi:hypothetical protein